MEIKCKILGELDYPNRDGIIYPKKEMEKAIKSWKENGKKFGELNPNYEHKKSEITLGNISHKVKDIYIDGDEVFAKVQLYDTPSGNIVKNIIDAGLDLKFAPRIFGNIKRIKKGPGKYSKRKEIRNIELVTVDII